MLLARSILIVSVLCLISFGCAADRPPNPVKFEDFRLFQSGDTAFLYRDVQLPISEDGPRRRLFQDHVIRGLRAAKQASEVYSSVQWVQIVTKIADSVVIQHTLDASKLREWGMDQFNHQPIHSKLTEFSPNSFVASYVDSATPFWWQQRHLRFAISELNSFMGIPWYSPEKLVRERLTSSGFLFISNDGKLAHYSGGTFLGAEPELTSLTFLHDSLYYARVMFTINEEEEEESSMDTTLFDEEPIVPNPKLWQEILRRCIDTFGSPDIDEGYSLARWDFDFGSCIALTYLDGIELSFFCEPMFERIFRQNQFALYGPSLGYTVNMDSVWDFGDY